MIKTCLFNFSNNTFKEKIFDNSIIPNVVINDDKLVIYWICKHVFPNHTIIDRQYMTKKGIPDFELLNFDNGERIFVEMKLTGGLSLDQLKFMFKNDHTYTLFYSIDNNPIEEIIEFDGV